MRSIAQILSSASHLWRYYLGSVLCAVAVAATSLLIPFVVAAATDTVVGAVSGETTVDSAVRGVLWLALGLLAAEVANAVLQNVGGYLGDTMTAKLRATLSARYYAKLLSLPQRYFDNALTGTVISRLTRSITEVTQFLNTFANNFFPMLLTVGAVLVISARYSLLLAGLVLLIFPLYTWLTALTSKRWVRLEGQKNEQVDLAGGRFAEVVGQVRVVKSFVREESELREFSDRYARTVATTKVQSRWWHFMDGLRRTALGVIFFGIYAIIFVRTARGEITVGEMVLLVQLMAMVRQPVTMMSYLVDVTQRAIAGSKDYFAVLDEDTAHERVLTAAPPGEDETAARPDGSDAPAAGPASGPAGSGSTAALTVPADRAPERLTPASPGAPLLEFDRVTFAYEPGSDVLHDVSFTVPAGHRVALVGESGGGKSTIVSLLLGLYLPTGGAIRILGHELADVGLERLRRGVGVVFQDASLFSGTIRENIAYGRPGATDDEIVHAAREANAHDFVARLGDGYDTIVGERGLKLSGGQKQRIAVARAMLKDAPLLVLDEATSALDTKAERQVQAGLERLMAGRTSIIIAHRLSTIAEVETIVTLREGHVDEIGSPAELAVSAGIYAELLTLQASASAADRKRLRRFGIHG